MEKRVNKEEVKNMLANLFMDELQGYELKAPQVKLLFSTSAMDYVPGIMVEAERQKEVKYLVYLPLQLSINIFDELPQTPDVELNKNYHLGILNARIIRDGDSAEIILDKDIFVGKPCRDKTQAEMLIKAYVIMSDMQYDYFKIVGEDIFSDYVSGTKYWIKPSRGNNAFWVNSNNSEISYCRMIGNKLE